MENRCIPGDGGEDDANESAATEAGGEWGDGDVSEATELAWHNWRF